MNLRQFSISDWRQIQQNIVWLIAAVLFAGLALLFTQSLLYYHRNQLQPLQAQLRKTRAAADAAETSLQDARNSEQHYLELSQRGLIGRNEHRLEWVEKIIRLGQTDPMLGLSYEIKPQRKLEMSEPSGGMALYASRMSLKYSALHEDAFSRMHWQLQALPGWPAPQRCLITRIQESPRLAVECDYDWMSIAPAADDIKEGG